MKPACVNVKCFKASFVVCAVDALYMLSTYRVHIYMCIHVCALYTLYMYMCVCVWHIYCMHIMLSASRHLLFAVPASDACVHSMDSDIESQGDDFHRFQDNDVISVDSGGVNGECVEISSGSSSDEDMSTIRTMRSRRSHVASSKVGISPTEYRRMKRWGCPVQFFVVLHLLQLLNGVPRLKWDVTEWMSGVEQIVRAAQDRSDKSPLKVYMGLAAVLGVG